MTPGATDTVSWSDRLLARWEVSQLAAVPCSFTVFSIPIGLLIFLLALLGGRPMMIAALMLVPLWLVLVGLDMGRGWWLSWHRHASPRWLRGVRAAVGQAVFDEALNHLTLLYGDDPEYRIERVHMAQAVRLAWSIRRDARQRAKWVALGNALRQA